MEAKKRKLNDEKKEGGEWSKGSWRKFPAKQQPPYTDQSAVSAVVSELAGYPPLVGENDVNVLRRAVASAAKGEAFLLIAGDCAEPFNVRQDRIEANAKVLQQLAMILTHAIGTPTIAIGRMAGQYAKPRSNDAELVDEVEYASFRGFNVNSLDLSQRTPDPNRLKQGYLHACATYTHLCRFVRASPTAGVLDGVSGSLKEVQDMIRLAIGGDDGDGDGDGEAADSETNKDVIDGIADRLYSAAKAAQWTQHWASIASNAVSEATTPFFIAHEAIILPYEEAMTRQSTTDDKFYNLGAHMVWIGDRTRQLNHAHVEYCRGIANPIGIKCGPSSDPLTFVDLIRKLNPKDEGGKIVVITRFGTGLVPMLLPIIKAIGLAGVKVAWQCDPMHGNTVNVSHDGKKFKTRKVDDIIQEIIATKQLLEQHGQRLCGLHLEMTGEAVTECVGGPGAVGKHTLHTNYTTACDPRLNYVQSLEVACALAKEYK